MLAFEILKRYATWGLETSKITAQYTAEGSVSLQTLEGFVASAVDFALNNDAKMRKYIIGKS